MEKKVKDSAIEQVMEELHQEMEASLPSPDLFVPDLQEQQDPPVQPLRGEAEKKGSLIHFAPLKDFKKEKQDSEPKQAKENHLLEELSDADKQPTEKKPSAEKKSPVKRKKEALKVELKSPKRLSNEKKVMHQEKNILPMLENREKTQGVGASYGMNSVSQAGVPMQIALKQSENLRVAQERIVTLEAEIERLRKENEELIATGDIFRERLDKMIIQNENLKRAYEESREEFQDEKRTLVDTLNDQNREIEKMTFKNKELEKRLSNNIQQIRVRERELENRLELMKLDNQTLSREKDQYILDLKRQVDKIKMDLDNQKNRRHEISQRLDEYRNKNRRAVRGLQMALHILRGNDLSPGRQEEQSEE